MCVCNKCFSWCVIRTKKPLTFAKRTAKTPLKKCFHKEKAPLQRCFCCERRFAIEKQVKQQTLRAVRADTNRVERFYNQSPRRYFTTFTTLPSARRTMLMPFCIEGTFAPPMV